MLALLAVVALMIAAAGFGLLIWSRASESARDFRRWRWPLLVIAAAAVSLTATLASLYLSEKLHYKPCVYCWYQRIAMYSLALILVIAAFRRDRGVKWYGVALAGVGLLISTWHILYDQIPSLQGTGSCDPANPCSLRWISMWEVTKDHPLITIQSMAWCGFAACLALLLLVPSDRLLTVEDEAEPVATPPAPVTEPEVTPA